jgi:hypothetical protein
MLIVEANCDNCIVAVGFETIFCSTRFGFCDVFDKGKGKGHPSTGHEGP